MEPTVVGETVNEAEVMDPAGTGCGLLLDGDPLVEPEVEVGVEPHPGRNEAAVTARAPWMAWRRSKRRGH